MALYFSEDPKLIDGSNIVNGTQIDRVWEYNYTKERWELVKFDSLSFEAEAPIVNYEKDGNIVHDFDVQDLQGV